MHEDVEAWAEEAYRELIHLISRAPYDTLGVQIKIGRTAHEDAWESRLRNRPDPVYRQAIRIHHLLANLDPDEADYVEKRVTEWALWRRDMGSLGSLVGCLNEKRGGGPPAQCLSIVYVVIAGHIWDESGNAA
jgi:hypothetical protein